jgi:hypothetical protein
MAQTPISPRQSNPSADTDTEIYDCPDGATFVGWLTVANRSSTATSFRAWIEIDNAATGDSQYLAYGVPIEGNETLSECLKVTMSADDRFMVRAEDATLSFSLFGVEQT